MDELRQVAEQTWMIKPCNCNDSSCLAAVRVGDHIDGQIVLYTRSHFGNRATTLLTFDQALELADQIKRVVETTENRLSNLG